MIDNPWPALVYAMLVAAFLLLPYIPRWEKWRPRAETEDLWFAVLMIAGGGLLAFLHGWELVECSILLLLSAFGQKWRVLAGAAAAALLFLPATWWMGAFEYSLKHRIAIAIAARRHESLDPRQGPAGLRDYTFGRPLSFWQRQWS